MLEQRVGAMMVVVAVAVAVVVAALQTAMMTMGLTCTERVRRMAPCVIQVPPGTGWVIIRLEGGLLSRRPVPSGKMHGTAVLSARSSTIMIANAAHGNVVQPATANHHALPPSCLGHGVERRARRA